MMKFIRMRLTFKHLFLQEDILISNKLLTLKTSLKSIAISTFNKVMSFFLFISLIGLNDAQIAKSSGPHKK
jgi:hypothetical protein